MLKVHVFSFVYLLSMCLCFPHPVIIRRADPLRTRSARSSTQTFISDLFTPSSSTTSSTIIGVAAPMVSQSEFAFRQMCRNHNAKLTFTQMLHAKNFISSKAFRRDTFDFNPAVEGSANCAPVVGQLCGNDKLVLLEAAKIIQSEGIDGVDLNLGCPQRIAKKGFYGAFLLPQTDLVLDIVDHLSSNLQIPISVKIRVQSPETDLALCTGLQDAGASMITVHGRTVKENKTATRSNNFDAIKRIVDATSIPIISNGGIEHFSDVESCLAATNAAGVMSSEALLENPSLFAGESFPATTAEWYLKQLRLAKEYLAIAEKYPPIGTGQSGGHSTIKAHVFKILYVALDRYQDLRNELGAPSVREIAHTKNIVRRLEERIFAAIERGELGELGELTPANASEFQNSWYRRHRHPTTFQQLTESDEITNEEIRQRALERRGNNRRR